MLFYFYVLFVILLHLIPMGGYSLNTMEFGPFRADYLFHALVFFPWMFLCLLLPGSRSTEISIGTWLGWMIVGIAFAVAAEGVQYWLPHRSFNPMDALFNALGVVIGGVAAGLWLLARRQS